VRLAPPDGVRDRPPASYPSGPASFSARPGFLDFVAAEVVKQRKFIEGAT